MTGIFVLGRSAKANSDLSAKQGFAAKLVTNGDTVDIISAATDRFHGVILNDPTSGQTVQLGILGIIPVVSDGTTNINTGDLVGPDANGRFVKKATADYNVAGTALDPSTAVGTVIRVLMTPNAVFRTLAG